MINACQYIKHISMTIEVIMKLHIKMHLILLTVMSHKKHSKVQLTAFKIHLNYNKIWFNCKQYTIKLHSVHTYIYSFKSMRSVLLVQVEAQ